MKYGRQLFKEFVRIMVDEVEPVLRLALADGREVKIRKYGRGATGLIYPAPISGWLRLVPLLGRTFFWFWHTLWKAF